MLFLHSLRVPLNYVLIYDLFILVEFSIELEQFHIAQFAHVLFVNLPVYPILIREVEVGDRDWQSDEKDRGQGRKKETLKEELLKELNKNKENKAVFSLLQDNIDYQRWLTEKKH